MGYTRQQIFAGQCYLVLNVGFSYDSLLLIILVDAKKTYFENILFLALDKSVFKCRYVYV